MAFATTRSPIVSTPAAMWSASGDSGSSRNAWTASKSSHGAAGPMFFPPDVVVEIKAIACQLPLTWGCPIRGCTSRTSAVRFCGEAWSPRSPAPPSGGGWTMMRSDRGRSGVGSSLVTLSSRPRRASSSTSTPARLGPQAGRQRVRALGRREDLRSGSPSLPLQPPAWGRPGDASGA